jgi:hypothetical protein
MFILMFFLADSFNAIEKSNNKAKIIPQIYEIEKNLQNIKNQYLS